MPIRELNTSTKIETAPAPVETGFRIFHAPRTSGHAGIALRVARGKNGTVGRTIQVIARGPDRQERRVFVSQWPPEEGQTLTDVMARACTIRDRVKKGLDPFPPPLPEDLAEPTISAIWARYAKTHGPDKKASTAANDDRLWRLHIKPYLRDKRPADLTYDVLKRWYSRVAATHVVTANRAFALLKAVFNAARRKWREPWAAANPLDVIGPEDRRKERERTVVLTPLQRERLFRCIREHPVAAPAKPDKPRRKSPGEAPDAHRLAKRQSANCLLLIALTGCRKSKALDARWSEFDLDGGYWNIPASRTKQNRLTRIPLLPEALSHLKTLYDARTSDTLLFPQAQARRTSCRSYS